MRPIFALALGFTGACGLFPSLDGLSDGGTDGGADVIGVDAQPDVSVGLDAGIDAYDGGCPVSSGPVMLHAGSFCIDSTQVTNGQYADFLAQDGGAMPAACSYKTTHVPDSWPAARVDTPVTYIDWCDAYAFCTWAGKRLCGKVGGGPSTSLADNTDQWYAACSHGDDGAHAYAYGNSFVLGTCNTPESSDAGDIVPVASLPLCVGGYPGLHDMIGNVYEWEDSCVGTSGESDLCVTRSGSWNDPTGPDDNCANAGSSARNFTQPDFGFRCCSP
jgi:formylglycine-generating enzyme required for sulfatase activity